jgi:hypothetical protein
MGVFPQNVYKTRFTRRQLLSARTMSMLTRKKMCLTHTECADSGDVKHTADTMVLLLNDGTDGANGVCTYYIKIVVGPTLSKSVYEFFERLLAEKKQYLESTTFDGLCRLRKKNNVDDHRFAEVLGCFFDNHIILANRLSIDHPSLPDMSLIKFVVNYYSA